MLHAIMSDYGAYLLREKTGTSEVAETLRRAIEILAHWDTPHLVVGGIAVQEHGYYRVTTDVDIVVPDTIEAVEVLTADSWTGAPTRRAQDRADVVNLIVARKLPRDLILHRAVQRAYEEIWDALQKEGPGPQA